MITVLLLLTLYVTSEAATVSLAHSETHGGAFSSLYPWPALGRFTLSVTCSTKGAILNFYLDGGDKVGDLTWDMDDKSIRVECYSAEIYYGQNTDCSGGSFTYNVEVIIIRDREVHISKCCLHTYNNYKVICGSHF